VVFENRSLRRQFGDVGRFDLRAAIEAAIRVAEIVDEEEDHIRPRRSSSESGGKGEKEERFHGWNRLNEGREAIIHAPSP